MEFLSIPILEYHITVWIELEDSVHGRFQECLLSSSESGYKVSMSIDGVDESIFIQTKEEVNKYVHRFAIPGTLTKKNSDGSWLTWQFLSDNPKYRQYEITRPPDQPLDPGAFYSSIFCLPSLLGIPQMTHTSTSTVTEKGIPGVTKGDVLIKVTVGDNTVDVEQIKTSMNLFDSSPVTDAIANAKEGVNKNAESLPVTYTFEMSESRQSVCATAHDLIYWRAEKCMGCWIDGKQGVYCLLHKGDENFPLMKEVGGKYYCSKCPPPNDLGVSRRRRRRRLEALYGRP